MRVPVLLVLAALFVAGCASPPAEGPDHAGEDAPLDLTGQLGLLLVDLDSGNITPLTTRSALAWMSANATVITWNEENFAIVVNTQTGARDVAPLVIWARVYDNATGLALEEGEAHLRDVVNASSIASVPVRESPNGLPWTTASDDLRLLAGEYAVGGRPSCASEIVFLSDRAERTVGCHLKVTPEGRAGWSEATGVRIREPNGTRVELTGFGGRDPTNGTFVGHENPVFTSDTVLMLRLTGTNSGVTLSEIVDERGEVLAKMDGPRRLALHDVSADGRLLLLRAFDRG